MNLIDEQFTKTPFYGGSSIAESLRMRGHQVKEAYLQADAQGGVGTEN